MDHWQVIIAAEGKRMWCQLPLSSMKARTRRSRRIGMDKHPNSNRSVSAQPRFHQRAAAIQPYGRDLRLLHLKSERGWGSGMNRLPDHLVPRRYFAIAVEKPTAR